MAKVRYYAIIAGGHKRIFSSWDECQQFRDMYPHGAQYKGFSTEQEAKKFLGIDDPIQDSSVYVVKKGTVPGVYSSWEECVAQVRGYPNPVFRKFPNRAMGENWLNAERTSSKAIAYTDGSFNATTRTWGYGVYLYDTENEETHFEFSNSGTNHSDAHNVAGEIYGVVRAIQEALELGYSEITVYHDYEGIEAWATERWAAKKSLTQWYQKKIKLFQQSIHVNFQKVPAHQGVKYNEIVDGLAKQAAGCI